jgi:outer membrane protein
MSLSLQRHGITLVAALLLSAMSPTLYAQVRIATVDLQRALNETEDGRRAKAQLQRLFKKRQEALDKRQNDLKTQKEAIEKNRDIWTKQKTQQAMEEYQKAFVDLQTTYVEYQRELAQKEAQLTARILERMQEIIRRIGQSEGYTMIVERNEGGVVWIPSNLDLTDQVIQRYNSGEGAEGGGGTKTKTKTKSGGGGGGGATKKGGRHALRR